MTLLDDPDREPLSSPELEVARLQVSRHIGKTPEWISRLLAGKHVEITRDQAAYFTAWKARFGVTEASAPTDTGQEPVFPRPGPLHGARKPDHAETRHLEPLPAPKAQKGAETEPCGESATQSPATAESGENSPIPTKESDLQHGEPPGPRRVGAGGNPAIAGSDGAAPASVAAPGILDPPGLESPHEIPVDGYNVAAPGEWLGLGRSSPHDAPAPGGPDDAGEHPQTPSEADAVSVAPAPGISHLDEDPPPW